MFATRKIDGIHVHFIRVYLHAHVYKKRVMKLVGKVVLAILLTTIGVALAVQVTRLTIQRRKAAKAKKEIAQGFQATQKWTANAARNIQSVFHRTPKHLDDVPKLPHDVQQPLNSIFVALVGTTAPELVARTIYQLLTTAYLPLRVTFAVYDIYSMQAQGAADVLHGRNAVDAANRQQPTTKEWWNEQTTSANASFDTVQSVLEVYLRDHPNKDAYMKQIHLIRIPSAEVRGGWTARCQLERLSFAASCSYVCWLPCPCVPVPCWDALLVSALVNAEAQCHMQAYSGQPTDGTADVVLTTCPQVLSDTEFMAWLSSSYDRSLLDAVVSICGTDADIRTHFVEQGGGKGGDSGGAASGSAQDKRRSEIAAALDRPAMKAAKLHVERLLNSTFGRPGTYVSIPTTRAVRGSTLDDLGGDVVQAGFALPDTTLYLPTIRVHTAHRAVSRPVPALTFSHHLLFCRSHRLWKVPTPEPSVCQFADDIEDAWMHGSLKRAGFRLFHPPCGIVFATDAAYIAQAIPAALPDTTILHMRAASKRGLMDGFWCGYALMASDCGIDPVTGHRSVPSTLGLSSASPEANELAMKVGTDDDYSSLIARLQLREKGVPMLYPHAFLSPSNS